MFCGKCGSPLKNSTSSFCGVCGNKISNDVETSQGLKTQPIINDTSSEYTSQNDYKALGALLDKNKEYYLKEFKKIDSGKRSFHWLYIIWPYMALYRKDFKFFKKYQLPFFIATGVCSVINYALSEILTPTSDMIEGLLAMLSLIDCIVIMAGAVVSLICFNKQYLKHLRKVIADNNLSNINNIDDVPNEVKSKVGVSFRYPLYFLGIEIGIVLVIAIILSIFMLVSNDIPNDKVNLNISNTEEIKSAKNSSYDNYSTPSPSSVNDNIDDTFAGFLSSIGIENSLISILGKDYDYFTECFGVTYEDFDENRNSYIISGGVRGLYTIMEAILEIHENGNISLGFLRDGKAYYYTNIEDEKYILPDFSHLYDWFNDKRPIVFMNSSQKLEFKNGTYINDNNDIFKFTFDGNIATFEGNASYGTHCGDVRGKIEISENFGVYNAQYDSDTKLYFNFFEDAILVYEQGQFGGMGVTFNGLYKIDNSEVKPNKIIENKKSEVYLTENENTQISLLLSNISEVGIQNISVDNSDDPQFIEFAIWHNWKNTQKVVTSNRDDFSSFLSKETVNSTIERYFGFNFTSHRDLSDYRFDGNGYHFWGADGAPQVYVKIEKMFDIGNGMYEVEGYTYYVDYII